MKKLLRTVKSLFLGKRRDGCVVPMPEIRRGAVRTDGGRNACGSRFAAHGVNERENLRDIPTCRLRASEVQSPDLGNVRLFGRGEDGPFAEKDLLDKMMGNLSFLGGLNVEEREAAAHARENPFGL